MEQPLVISIDDESSRFKKFLQLPGNDRIIFSAIFGSGKTYFLNEFFKSNTEEYVSIHLYPTNYSVSTNEDIFQYIKFDVLYELLNEPIDFEKLELDSLQAIAHLEYDDFKDIVKAFIKLIPALGKALTDVTEPIETLIDKLKKIGDIARQKGIDDGKVAKDLISEVENKKGSIYDHDVYTQLITKFISQLRNEKKKVVLIVDDLDRIDPEHIFRILNVFAVHFNNGRITEYENKFSIDKIVLCCDVYNIKSIFKARYGQSTDFSGYIDKFYTNDIFFFNNREIVASIVNKIVRSINSDNDNRFGGKAIAKPNYFDFTCYLLVCMIRSGTLNLRTLMRLRNIENPVHYYTLNLVKEVETYLLPLTQVFDFLLYIKGDSDTVSDSLNRTHFKPDNRLPNLLSLIGYDCLMLFDNRNHKFTAGKYELDSVTPYVVKDSREGQFARGADESFERFSPEKFKQYLVRAFETFHNAKLHSNTKEIW
jgi:hypothetical protein